jgi:hypothetical protein
VASPPVSSPNMAKVCRRVLGPQRARDRGGVPELEREKQFSMGATARLALSWVERYEVNSVLVP